MEAHCSVLRVQKHPKDLFPGKRKRFFQKGSRRSPAKGVRWERGGAAKRSGVFAECRRQEAETERAERSFFQKGSRRSPAKRVRWERGGAAKRSGVFAECRRQEAETERAELAPTTRPVGQVVKTAASHAVNIGSNPVRVTRRTFSSVGRATDS